VKTSPLNVDSEFEEPLPLTIEEFCSAEKFGKATYYKIRRLGFGPDETRIPGTSIVRITQQARRAWHAKLAALRASEAAETEARRRSVQAMQAGRIAAASPLHVSRRKGTARAAAKGRR
jgi:hypothetical protein